MATTLSKYIFLPTLNAKMSSKICSIRLNNKIEKHDFQPKTPLGLNRLGKVLQLMIYLIWKLLGQLVDQC